MFVTECAFEVLEDFLESVRSRVACSGDACASRGRAWRRVGRRSPPSEHSDGAAASKLAPEDRRPRHLAVTLLPELQFPLRHPVRRGLEVSAALDCFLFLFSVRRTSHRRTGFWLVIKGRRLF